MKRTVVCRLLIILAALLFASFVSTSKATPSKPHGRFRTEMPSGKDFAGAVMTARNDVPAVPATALPYLWSVR